MAGNIGGGRALRVCDLCGGVDDHPRHVLAGGDRNTYPAPTAETVRKVVEAAPEGEEDRLVADLLDTGTSDRHMDCCRAAGCPTGECDKVPDLRGRKLLDALMKEN